MYDQLNIADEEEVHSDYELEIMKLHEVLVAIILAS